MKVMLVGNQEQPEEDRVGTQEVLRRLVESHNWLVWAATAKARPVGGRTLLDWTFDEDFCEYLPPWFDIEKVGNHARSLTNARLHQENQRCYVEAHEAILSGKPSYRQIFRIRLRDRRISWIDERVAIKQVGPGCWRLVGLCVDATEHKEAEERRRMLHEELQAIRVELEMHNDELLGMREKLQADTEALALANKRLANLATTDGLTGIKNHRAFQVQLDRECRTASFRNRPLSVIMLDIDEFKEFNDKFGHPDGDDVLKEVGRILDRNARRTDFVARYGGEEFAIILPETDAVGAVTLAERFRRAIESGPWWARAITASLGVATCDEKIVEENPAADACRFTPPVLIADADRALYQAKSNGRNCVYHGTLHTSADRPSLTEAGRASHI